tara:strand:+ start:5043 stop:5228 length:186 start_codon:yes stop_codon:yes gene_type:complete
MAKSMKVPVLIFEHIQEPTVLLEGLNTILSRTDPSTKEDLILLLIKELEQTVEIMEKTNIR